MELKDDVIRLHNILNSLRLLNINLNAAIDQVKDLLAEITTAPNESGAEGEHTS